jgi:YaiO family outer membrane protein
MEPRFERTRSRSRHRWSVTLALPILIISLRLQGADPAAVESLIEEARHAMTRGDLAAATMLIDTALEDDPGQIDWRLLRAELHAARGQLLEAYVQASAIARDHPDDRRGRLLEARWLSHLGRLRSAQERYEILLEETPDDRDLRTSLALTFAWRGDWDGARVRLESVLAEDPHHEQAFLANLRVLIGSRQASAAWQRARQRDLETGEQDPELGLLMAGLAARIGARELAQSLAARPASDPDLLQRQTAFRAVESIRAGDLEQGHKLLVRSREHLPRTFDTLMEAANAHAAADQSGLARELYEQAIALTPERPEGHLGLARLASREGRLAGSLAIYRRVTRQNPEAIEGWLGIAAIARLLNDATLIELALEAAWSYAPRSALLHQERLRLALFNGDPARFTEALLRYLEDQPLDRNARLWELRLHRAERETGLGHRALAMLDPFEPDLVSQILPFLATDDSDPATLLAQLPDVPEPELVSVARLELAQRLAVALQPDLARELARRVSPDAERWTDVLGSAWWAYLSTPFATEPLLASTFDIQARAVWLAAQIQRRLQTLTIETGSGLEDDWLLQRALWFHQWRERWGSVEAATDLRARLVGLAPGWADPISLARIEDAWNRSEQPLPVAFATVPRLMARARWRQYRFEYAGALELLGQLWTQYPASAEPAFAQVEILRASGRWTEALSLLAQLTSAGSCPPGVRIQHVELLRRSGRFAEAGRQLELLAAAGFDEPDLYRHQALIAQAAARPDEARRWIQAGLVKHPDNPDLILLQADRLRREGQVTELALLLDRPAPPGWINPDLLAGAWPELPVAVRDRILQSPSWWFNWHWLPWERLEGRSIAALDEASKSAVASGQFGQALHQLLPVLDAGIPDSDIWLKAGRLFDFDTQPAESARAYHYAGLLGLGRPDALTSELSQLATRRPIDAAREFARRLDRQPDDPGIRKGLVLALLRAGQVTAADRALAPLIEAMPEDAEVILLAAQVRGAMGRVRQARSLYHSLLRGEALHTDAHAGRLALRDMGEWGAALAYEFATLRDSTGSGANLDDWHEAQLSVFWRRPQPLSLSLDYRWIDRHQEQAQELTFHVARGLNRNWILRLHSGAALAGRLLPSARLGAGVDYRFHDAMFGALDVRYLHFPDVAVVQVVPAATWRWHPRGTVEGRVYLGQNMFRHGSDRVSVTGMLQSSWRLTGSLAVALHYAIGDDNSFDPIPGLIADDSFQSVGGHLRLEGPHGWTLHPAYRYERHQRFELHAFGMALSTRF